MSDDDDSGVDLALIAYQVIDHAGEDDDGQTQSSEDPYEAGLFVIGLMVLSLLVFFLLATAGGAG